MCGTGTRPVPTPPLQKQAGNFRHRAAGRHHIVHQGNVSACQRLMATKGATQVAPAHTGRQPLLWSGFSYPPQGGRAIIATQPVRQRPRQQIALVIAASPTSPFLACKGTAKIISGLFRYCSLCARCQFSNISRASGGRRVELPQLPRVPAVACVSPNEVIVHGIPGPRFWRRATSSRSTAAPSSRAGTPTPPSPFRWGRRCGVAAPHGRDPGRPGGAILATVEGNRLGDIGAAAERGVNARGLRGRPRIRRARIGTAMHEEPDVRTTAPAAGE